MSGNAETNVRIAPSALEALTQIMARHGTSRDATIRRLLTEHVALQEQRHPEDRMTHISTVLRYPPPPRWRGDPRHDVPLRVRAPASLLVRARAVSLQLPGQHPRAHRDYQSRLLTDAVTTAIAQAEPFTDPFLTGLLPLLRHGAALGLWRLAVAASSTAPEKAWLKEAEVVRAGHRLSSTPQDPDDQHLLRVAEALELNEAWHATKRFRMATAAARRFLTGPGAEDVEQALYEQGDAWNTVYKEWLKTDWEGRPFRRRHGITSYDWTGRGGAAVWRAERRVNLEYFEDWLVGRTKGDPAAGVMEESGTPLWLLRTPAAWCARAPRSASRHACELYASWVADGSLLAFPYRSRQAFWPLQRQQGTSGFEPVPGFEPVAAAAAGLHPDKVTGFIEAVLIDWNHTFAEEPSVRVALDLPADRARRFGFITAEEQHRAMAEARATTLKVMDDVIAWAAGKEASPLHLLKLKDARGNAPEFHRLTRNYPRHKRPKFHVARATWTWPGGSVAAELAAGTPPDLVQWLATAAHSRSSLILEQAMEQAWHRAFDQYGFRM
ncbi:hypothetical protein JK359_36755 [Streptomyces actinomycinicus]|uniref:Uncharacterized protein n=1 Tax=Streptomyces actinomycinicus TaxID=1695166 RepID=A0A937EQ12_9ACTN|nr:hypothetical protein [Streptomyces actinomycinicus]MBL1087442.1 hypothetical protein [Streptomyces actinomycinicus]